VTRPCSHSFASTFVSGNTGIVLSSLTSTSSPSTNKPARATPPQPASRERGDRQPARPLARRLRDPRRHEKLHPARTVLAVRFRENGGNGASVRAAAHMRGSATANMFVSPMSASPRAAAGRGARLGGRAAWQLPVHDPLLEPATRSLTPRWTTGSGGDPRVAGTCAPRGGRRRAQGSRRRSASSPRWCTSCRRPITRAAGLARAPTPARCPHLAADERDQIAVALRRGGVNRIDDAARSDEETPRKAMGSELQLDF
jgi:hypothetical protein